MILSLSLVSADLFPTPSSSVNIGSDDTSFGVNIFVPDQIFNSSAATSNSTRFWVTNSLGTLDDANTTQFDNIAGTLTIDTTYIDAHWCALTGCTMSGDIDMDGNTLDNVFDLNMTNQIKIEFDNSNFENSSINIINHNPFGISSQRMVNDRGEEFFVSNVGYNLSQLLFPDIVGANDSVNGMTGDGVLFLGTLNNKSIFFGSSPNREIAETEFFLRINPDLQSLEIQGNKFIRPLITNSVQTMLFESNIGAAEGEITFAFIGSDANNNSVAQQVFQIGKNNSASVQGMNSQIVAPKDFLTMTADVKAQFDNNTGDPIIEEWFNNITSCLVYEAYLQGLGFLDEGLQNFCDTTSRGVPQSILGDITAVRSLVGHGGTTLFKNLDVIIRDNSTDLDLIGGRSLHIRRPRVEQIGVAPGEEVNRLLADFEQNQLLPFVLITSGKGADEWDTVSDPINCPPNGDFCAHAGPTGGSGATIMDSNITTSNTESMNITFNINTLDMPSGGLLVIDMENSTTSTNLYTLSLTDVSDLSVNVAIPSQWNNLSLVTISASFLSVHPIRGDVWIDTIRVDGIASASTLENITRQDGEICFSDGVDRGDGSNRCVYDIFWNDSTKNLNLPGNTTFEDVTEINLNITSSITLNGTIIEDWGDIPDFFKLDGSSIMQGNANFGGFNIFNISNAVITNNLTVDTDTLFVDSVNDRVGIGTSSPSALLHISYTGVTDGSLDSDSESIVLAKAGGTSLRFGVDDTNKLGIIQVAEPGIGVKDLVLQTAGGNVGIGTTSPQNKLDVAGAQVIGSSFAGVNTAPTDGLLVEGDVGIGLTDPAQKFEIGSNDGTDRISIYHDNSNAYMKWDDGILFFQTDEGTNTNTKAVFQGKGTGYGEIVIKDSDTGDTVEWYVNSNNMYFNSIGTTDMYFDSQAINDISFWQFAAEGATKEFKIHGYRTGDSKRALEIGVGVDADDTASFDGLGNYRFDGRMEIMSDDSSDMINIYHDNNNAIFNWDEGNFVLTSKEAANADSKLNIVPDGTGQGSYQIDGLSLLRWKTGQSDVESIPAANANYHLFGTSSEGETMELKVSGFRTGDSLRTMAIGVGVDADDTASFDGVSNYFFDGNVGIGTATPDASIEIDRGDASIHQNSAGNVYNRLDRGTTNAQGAVTFETAGVAKSGIGTDNDGTENLYLWSGGSLSDARRRMTIDPNGNVGIGTTSPGSKLEVNGSMYVSDSISVNSANGVITAPTFKALVGLDGFSTNYPLAIQSRPFTQANKFGVTMSTGTHSQTSGDNGALKINPTYNQVSGTASNTDLLINRIETAVGSGNQYLIDAQVGGVSKFVLTNQGNVGIGTTTPSVKLHVFSGGGVYIQASNPTLRFGDSFASTYLKMDGSGNLDVLKTDGSTSIMRFDKDGNVGIGTTSPQNKLDVLGAMVIGSSYAGVNTAPTDGLLVEGNVETGGNFTTNDRYFLGNGASIGFNATCQMIFYNSTGGIMSTLGCT